MNVDLEFLKKVVQARLDVGEWLANRPYTGLDVTDVETLVNGFDYLAIILKDITGDDISNLNAVQIEQPTMTITYGE